MTTLAGGFIFGSLTFLIPRIFEVNLSGISVDIAITGLLAGIVYAIASLSQVGVGYLIDRYSPKIILGFVIAVFLNNQVLKLAPFFRTIIFMPVVTAIAIIGIVMTFVFSPFNGPANKFLMGMNITSGPIDFLGDPNTVLPTVMGVYVWKWLGITMMYWLAALQTVPQDVYDAAKIDGAQGFKLWFHIILPIVLPFAIVIVLVEAVGALNVFPLIETMTAGGPFFSSEVMEVYIFRTAFVTDSGTMPRLGYACAAGVIWGVAVLYITCLIYTSDPADE